MSQPLDSVVTLWFLIKMPRLESRPGEGFCLVHNYYPVFTYNYIYCPLYLFCSVLSS